MYYSTYPLDIPELPIYVTSNDTTNAVDACDPLPDDTPDLSEHLVIIRRGTCTFVRQPFPHFYVPNALHIGPEAHKCGREGGQIRVNIRVRLTLAQCDMTSLIPPTQQRQWLSEYRCWGVRWKCFFDSVAGWSFRQCLDLAFLHPLILECSLLNNGSPVPRSRFRSPNQEVPWDTPLLEVVSCPHSLGTSINYRGDATLRTCNLATGRRTTFISSPR